MTMADEKQPIKQEATVKAMRFPENWFRSKSDFELYEMACDQMDEGVNCDFYAQVQNTGFVKMFDGSRKQYFMK